MVSSNTMKILMLNGARRLIGEAAHTFDLTEELNKRGHDVRLVLRANSNLLERAQKRELPVALTMRHASGFHPLHSVGEFRALRRYILDFQPDIIHCHRGNDHGLAVAVVKTFPRSQMPTIIRTRHRVVPVKNTIANRWMFTRNTHGIISVSQGAARSFGAMQPMLSDKMSVVYSSVDTVNFTPGRRSDSWRESQGVAADAPLIGLIARLQRVKGQKPFLLAARQVLKEFPNAKFLMAGPGPDSLRQKLTRYMNDLGIADSVIFDDWLDDIATATASLDVGVLASLGSEASSRIVYEYMASGAAVVATSVGCIPELLTDENQVGIMIPPGDPPAMAEAICQALRTPAMRDDMRKRAREYIEKNHNRELWVTSMLDAYQQAIARRKGDLPQVPGRSSYRLVLTGRLNDNLNETQPPV